jgi:hypothetical protein
LASKYQYTWLTPHGNECRVEFDFSDYTGNPTIVDPTNRPFVIREYNSENDLFKPIRATQAEMQILSSSTVSMDDFVRDSDDIVTVKFYFESNLFWKGNLVQDDFQEEWTDTRHVITLRAADGFGQIDAAELTIPGGQNSFLDYMALAVEPTTLTDNAILVNSFFINDVYYDGMTVTDGLSLSQCTVDGRTFQGDSRSNILTKINRAWAQTIFQHVGKWFTMRLEPMFAEGDVTRINYNFISGNSTSTKNYTVNVGPSEAVRLVAPFALKSVSRKTKKDRVEFYYEFPTEIIENQGFLDGDIIIPTTDTYTIDNWTLYKTSFGTPVAGTADYWRKEEKDVDGNITDNYMFIGSDAALHYSKSTGILLNVGDRMDLSFEFRSQRNVSAGPGNIEAAAVLFETATDKYTLNEDGEWYLSNASYTTNFKFIQVSYSAAELLTDWKNVEVKSKQVPGEGTLYFCFVNNHGTDTDSNFKGLDIVIREASKQPGVVGDYDQYTKTEDIKANYTEQIFMDDSNNRYHKGAIHYAGDLTGDNWFRTSNNTERLTFKRMGLISHMLISSRNRIKLDVTLDGLSWLDGGVTRPVWFQNKFVFHDEPDKRFMITNLSEMDFGEGRIRASMLEVHDVNIDPMDYPEHTFGNIYEKDT